MTFQPRPLTLPVAFLAAYILVILNVTGIPSVWGSGGGIDRGANMFGWPKWYLVTNLTKDQHSQLGRRRPNVRYSTPKPGTIPFSPNDVQRFSARSLSFNVLACAVSVLVLTLVVEYWQRFFRYPGQISLRSIFLFVFLAALIAWFARTTYAVELYCWRFPWPHIVVTCIFIVCVMATALFTLWQNAVSQNSGR